MRHLILAGVILSIAAGAAFADVPPNPLYGSPIGPTTIPPYGLQVRATSTLLEPAATASAPRQYLYLQFLPEPTPPSVIPLQTDTPPLPSQILAKVDCTFDGSDPVKAMPGAIELDALHPTYLQDASMSHFVWQGPIKCAAPWSSHGQFVTVLVYPR